eukprot:scaffold2508_cov93-Skeletonema_marinoi.AAC.4
MSAPGVKGEERRSTIPAAQRSAQSIVSTPALVDRTAAARVLLFPPRSFGQSGAGPAGAIEGQTAREREILLRKEVVLRIDCCPRPWRRLLQ